MFAIGNVKFAITIVALSLAVNYASAQPNTSWSGRDMVYRGENFDVRDSNRVPKNRMDQHRKYLNHQYAFPAKPRSMWEIGVGGGMYNVLGDIRSTFGYGLHAHIRKSLGHLLSIRMQYIYGVGKGQAWKGLYDYSPNTAWVGNGYKPINRLNPAGTPADMVFYNYRMESHQLNFDVIASINTINFYKARTSLSLYGFVGIGALAYNTRVDALGSNGQRYNYENAVGNLQATRENKKEIVTAVEGIQDGEYETPGHVMGDALIIFNNKTLVFAPSVGVGAQMKISNRINIAIEDRFTFTSGDLLDGSMWHPTVVGAIPSSRKDAINYLSLGLNFNLGNKTKRVEPLYWLNPMDHAYNELSYPRHMILPDPVLPDSDNDGITDQFDKCPGTPNGIAVDSHGCPMDTDGDGVPDDRDKQLITPTECQPVDAEGVGKCPCPDGCGSLMPACGNIGAGSVIFTGSSANITPSAQAQLSSLSAQMMANPTCKVVIIGAGNASKVQQQRSWDRVNAVIEFMSEKHGIDRKRFIFQYGQAGDPNSVMYRSALPGEEGPANVAPPFPNLRK